MIIRYTITDGLAVIELVGLALLHHCSSSMASALSTLQVFM